MTGLMKRIFRRRAADQPRGAGVASSSGGHARGERLPGYRRIGRSLGLARLRQRLPWGAPTSPIAASPGPGQTTQQIAAPAALAPSFQDRSRLRRRLRFLRRARELGFRDVGGLIFDMRRFGRNRPDLLDAKLDALLVVDQELRALEGVLDDRRAFHTLHEPGVSACPRCGTLHSSDANFCPQCGMLISGPRPMGELGAPIAAPPHPQGSGAQQDWPWPSPPATDEQPVGQPTSPTVDQPTSPTVDQPTSPTILQSAPETDQPTVAYAPEPSHDDERTTSAIDPAADVRPEDAPASRTAVDDAATSGEEPTQTDLPPQASGGS